jgi:tRNA threonylcarbamoyladenosine biosynthesis protein TsaE
VILSLPDLDAVAALGRRIAAKLRPGDVVALSGDLGAGKTTLSRAILAAAGHAGEVPSPTFTIIETYVRTDPPIVHADFYRLDDPSELEEIGLDDYREGAALLAEWPDRAGGFAHEPACLSVELENGGEGRRAIVEGGSAWHGRMP